MNVDVVKIDATEAAIEAANAAFAKIGEAYPCGFAWVTVTPVNKGNTVHGRMERKFLKELGFNQSYTNTKQYQLWNPSKHSTQNMNVKLAGAEAYAKVLVKSGLNAFADCRMD